VFNTAASAIWLREHIPLTGLELHDAAFEAAASTSWATGARGASGGQRSRNLRDVGAALCQLSYAGVVGSGGVEPPSSVYQTAALNRCATIRSVGPQRFELRSACYKQAALTVELRAVRNWWAGRDLHPHSKAALLQSVGLTHAQPARGAATGNRTLTACLEGRYACPLRHSSVSGPASRLRTYSLPIKSRLLCQLSYSGMPGATGGTRTPISSLKRRVL
jgi:hypothetical protein